MRLVRPGSPAVYGQRTATVAMNTDASLAGTPEIDHINTLVGRLARHHRLPWRRSGGCSSSKLVDAQAGYESARNMCGVLMAGANFVLSTTGYLECPVSDLRQDDARRRAALGDGNCAVLGPH